MWVPHGVMEHEGGMWVPHGVMEHEGGMWVPQLMELWSTGD